MIQTLTDRERRVWAGVLRGLATKEIAAELAVGNQTIVNARRSLAQKLNVRTGRAVGVVGLVRAAHAHGII